MATDKAQCHEEMGQPSVTAMENIISNVLLVIAAIIGIWTWPRREKFAYRWPLLLAALLVLIAVFVSEDVLVGPPQLLAE